VDLQNQFGACGNYRDGLSPSDPLIQQVVSNNDGIEDEEGFTRYGDGYLTGSAWLQRIQLIESVQKQHKPYYIINQFPSVGHAEIQWALASYLMGKEHSAALFIYGLDPLVCPSTERRTSPRQRATQPGQEHHLDRFSLLAGHRRIDDP
jgi:hypothetical protein